MTFYPAPADNSGVTIIANPGGGYNILAYNLEGTEICKRFNSHGINCVLVKYRVPRAKGLGMRHPFKICKGQLLIPVHILRWNIKPDKMEYWAFRNACRLWPVQTTIIVHI